MRSIALLPKLDLLVTFSLDGRSPGKSPVHVLDIRGSPPAGHDFDDLRSVARVGRQNAVRAKISAAQVLCRRESLM